jgi:hypothetical protein
VYQVKLQKESYNVIRDRGGAAYVQEIERGRMRLARQFTKQMFDPKVCCLIDIGSVGFVYLCNFFSKSGCLLNAD